MALTRDVVNCPRIGILAMFTRLNFGNLCIESIDIYVSVRYATIRKLKVSMQISNIKRGNDTIF